MQHPKKTLPAVYILESLRFDDEKHERFEGRLLLHHLELAGIRAQYFYFRTDIELDVLLDSFRKSGFRYLHLSCHGSHEAVEFTLCELGVEELALRLGSVLDNRRLFLSACRSACDRLAKELFMQAPDCYSMIGPAHDVQFQSAAIYWASFYHLLLTGDKTAISRKQVSATAQRLASLFAVPVNCFFSSKTDALGFRRVRFPNRLSDRRRDAIEKVLQQVSSRRRRTKLRRMRKSSRSASIGPE